MIMIQAQKNGNLISTDWEPLIEALFSLSVDNPERVQLMGREGTICKAMIPKEWKGQDVTDTIFREAQKPIGFEAPINA